MDARTDCNDTRDRSGRGEMEWRMGAARIQRQRPTATGIQRSRAERSWRARAAAAWRRDFQRMAQQSQAKQHISKRDGDDTVRECAGGGRLVGGGGGEGPVVADDCGWQGATARAWLAHRSCTLCTSVRIASHSPVHSALHAATSMAAGWVALHRLSRPALHLCACCRRTPCGYLPFSSFPASCSFRQPCLCRVTDVNRKPNRCTVQTDGPKGRPDGPSLAASMHVHPSTGIPSRNKTRRETKGDPHVHDEKRAQRMIRRKPSQIMIKCN